MSNKRDFLLHLSSKELDELASEIREIKQEKDEKELKLNVNSHKQCIGKCYKAYHYDTLNNIKIIKYIKLVRAESKNEYWMEALMFENPLNYTFDKQAHLMHHRGDYLFGRIAYEGIKVKSVGWFTTSGQNGYEEISLEEFNKALDEHVEALKTMDWTQ